MKEVIEETKVIAIFMIKSLSRKMFEEPDNKLTETMKSVTEVTT